MTPTAFAFLVSCALLPASLAQASTMCDQYLGFKTPGMFTVVMCADPGAFSGTPEAHYIIDNLKELKQVPNDMTICSDVKFGTLMGQLVMVATSGIGPGPASSCTQEVTQFCGTMIESIIYSGTSGWSPQLGGVVTPPSCNAANSGGQIVRTGDICISPLSVNWNCKKASWNEQASGYPNSCFRPEEKNGPADSFLYGDCEFYQTYLLGNLELAEELLNAATSDLGQMNFPERNAKVAFNDEHYWGVMSNGTNVVYTAPKNGWQKTNPTVFNYTQCMEVDGQFFYSGNPFEIKARDYISDTFNKASKIEIKQCCGRVTSANKVIKRYKHCCTANSKMTSICCQKYNAAMAMKTKHTPCCQAKPANHSGMDMIAVSAMEAIGIGQALEEYNSLAQTMRKIPHTNIRAASNWLVQPLTQTEPGVWEQYEEVAEDFVNGYGFAIAAESSVVLTMYQNRCLKMGKKASVCKFTIEYM